MSEKSLNIKIERQKKIRGFEDAPLWYRVSNQPLSKTLQAIFREKEIPFNPLFHVLEKRGSRSIPAPVDWRGTVGDFYQLYRKSMPEYFLFIKRKPEETDESSTPPMHDDWDASNSSGYPVATGRVPLLVDLESEDSEDDDDSTREMPNLTTQTTFEEQERYEDSPTPPPIQSNVESAIRTYVTVQISIEDMLNSRNELAKVIGNDEFIKLQGLIPFTIGIIRTAFVVDYGTRLEPENTA